MEWTGQQQIYFLLQSVVLGAGQGLLLDVLTGMVRIPNRRRWLWTDIVFGPVAAVITFFGALVIMDGQMHPLLFFGIFVGMLIEHVTIGSMLCRCVRFLRRQMRRGVLGVHRLLCFVGRSITIFFCRIRKKRKNDEKPCILSAFFSKKT